MLTVEAIEVHLRSPRKGQDEFREDVRELRADNTGLLGKFDTLSKKIDALDKNVGDRLDALNVTLSDKLDALNVPLGDKISLLNNSVSGVIGLQKLTLWITSCLGSLGIAGEIFHWF